jgi:uncharacterized repeat protein (TIGR03803 family)
MTAKLSQTPRLKAVAFASALIMAGANAHGAVLFKMVFSFNNTNGSSPNSLSKGLSNMFGTTASGGVDGYGTVFSFTTNGTLTSLTSFTNLSSSNFSSINPVGVVQKADGSFFGTSFLGGDYNNGTIFKLDTNFNPTFLLSFDHTNGALPRSGLLFNPNDGNYYGTTAVGGTNGNAGTIYKLAPNGTFTSILSFNGTNGNSPYSQLALAANGLMYGITSTGGTNNFGSVFRISTNGNFTNLYSCTGGTNGVTPISGLVQASDGLFYGTTSQNGSGMHGTIFRMDTNGNVTTLFGFDGTNGATPYSTLVECNGWLYGTTYFGGMNDYGTIFRINTNGTFTNLMSFNYTNGASPLGPLLNAGNGIIYGTTTQGGTNGGYGTIFQLTVLPALPTQLNVSQTGGSLHFTWNSVVGQTYQLQSTSSLSPSSWTNNGPVITATATNTTTTDSASSAQAFYRLLVAPQ